MSPYAQSVHAARKAASRRFGQHNSHVAFASAAAFADKGKALAEALELTGPYCVDPALFVKDLQPIVQAALAELVGELRNFISGELRTYIETDPRLLALFEEDKPEIKMERTQLANELRTCNEALAELTSVQF
jgi:hypothetical protein